MNDEESVNDPLSYIKEEVKEEESVDDPLYIQEEERRRDNDNICTVVKGLGLMMILSLFN